METLERIIKEEIIKKEQDIKKCKDALQRNLLRRDIQVLEHVLKRYKDEQ